MLITALLTCRTGFPTKIGLPQSNVLPDKKEKTKQNKKGKGQGQNSNLSLDKPNANERDHLFLPLDSSHVNLDLCFGFKKSSFD